MSHYTDLTIEHTNHIAIVTLRRPTVHNALGPQLIQELQTAFTTLADDERLHGVILAAEGASFCAGADMQAMRATINFTEEENVQDALRLADLLRTIQSFPCPVVARIQGSAIGGGVGLVAACDIAVAVEDAQFSFSEVRLGLAPAVISPYVVRKIGETHARALFVTGERFSAERARRIGLIHHLVTSEQLDEMIQKIQHSLVSSAPQAIRHCKALALTIGSMDQMQAHVYTAELIARLRVSAEGQEGLNAFLEKRPPRFPDQS